MHIPEKRKLIRLSAGKLSITAVLLAIVLICIQQLRAQGSEVMVPIDDLIIAQVTKGDLVREVRAPGTLVPLELHFLSAMTNARVKELKQEAGDFVEVGTVIMTLDNPELSLNLDAATYELALQQASFEALEQRLEQSVLSQQIKVENYLSQLTLAKQRRVANSKLAKAGIVSDINYKESELIEQQFTTQLLLEKRRLQSLEVFNQSELTVAQAKIDKAKRHLALQQDLFNSLVVKSKTRGVLQEILLKEGQQVTQGSVLAKVAGQDKLKAELKVHESQVKDVTKGQTVSISAGQNSVSGVVRRISPAVNQGTVAVDVVFDGEMITGARPDLRVTGIIELERLENVLKVKRPVFTGVHGITDVFALNKEGTIATRKQVKFGAGSVEYLQVLSNLSVDEHIVISSTNDYVHLNEFRVNQASLQL